MTIAVRGVGIEVGGDVVRAVALGDDADHPSATAEHVGGVDDGLHTVLARLVAAVGAAAGTPAVLAWEDRAGLVDAVDLTASTPGAVLARLRTWSAVGARALTVATDEQGRRSAVPVRWNAAAVSRLVDAAARAGLEVVGYEPAATAAARAPAHGAAHGAALVAAGLVSAPIRRAMPSVPAQSAAPPPVWVIERLPDDPADAVGPATAGVPVRRRRWRGRRH